MQRRISGGKAMLITQTLIASLFGYSCWFSPTATAQTATVQGATSSNSNYAAVEVFPSDQVSKFESITPDWWSVSGLFTGLSQDHPSFSSTYSGKNSLSPDNLSSKTINLTLFAGIRTSKNGKLWTNLEIDQK